MAGERVENVELEFIDSTDERIVIENSAIPITESGEVVGIQGVGRDITERKERERELRTLSRAIDDADLGITLADPAQPDTPLVYVNSGFERLTGYGAEEAVGRNCRFLQGHDTDPETVETLRAAIDTESQETVELINYQRDGTPFWNRLVFDPVDEDDDDEFEYYLGVQFDETERHRTTQLIALLNRVLRHNLRNDMGKVMGFANLIHTGEVDNADELAERIERVAQNLFSLGEHARKLEATATIHREPTRLDPTTLFETVATTHRERYPTAVIDVSITTDQDICAGQELTDALDEVVSNAIKHNAAAEQHVTATVSDAEDGWIRIDITDDGPGIDAMEAAVVASGNETALEHSSGLGLWLINWIVTRYGGSFWIEGHDEGTTATIHLPGIDDDTSVDAAERRPTLLCSTKSTR